MLPPDRVEELLTKLHEWSGETSLDIKATCAPMYYRISRQRGGGKPHARPKHADSAPAGHPHAAMGAHTKGCLAGTGVCFVSHKGEMMGCGYLPVTAGNVREQTFGEIWRSSELFGKLRDDHLLSGKCGVCEFRKVCGGCRARAFFEHGDYLAEEPYCQYQPRATNT